MIETLALWSGALLGVAVVLAIWLVWMGIGAVMFLSQANNPTGGNGWIAFSGVAMMLSGIGLLGWVVYWTISALF